MRGRKKKQNKNTHPHIALPSPSPQLALYLMYEKKQKDASCWKPLLDELDRIQGRGPSGAKSPLLWDAGQAADLLAGSPILGELAAREAAMRTEWDQMDDVWCGGEGEGKEEKRTRVFRNFDTVSYGRPLIDFLSL